MKISKVTDEHYFEIKKTLLTETPERTADIHGVSLKTVLQVRNSLNRRQYQELTKAQHPDTQFSLREHVLEAHDILFNQEAKQDNAGTAIVQIIFRLNELKKEGKI